MSRGGKEEYWKGAHVPQRAEQGQGREGGIKGRGGRFLWSPPPPAPRPPRAERRTGAAPLTDLKMSCFAFSLLSLFLQEATSRWAPNPRRAAALRRRADVLEQAEGAEVREGIRLARGGGRGRVAPR